MSYDGLYKLAEHDVSFNLRRKCYVDPDGSLRPYEIMVSRKPVFRMSGCEKSEFTENWEWREAYDKANYELFGGGFGTSPQSTFETSAACSDKEASALSSRRRARRKVFDYCMCNPFDCFVTLTLDGSLIQRDDYGAVIKKLTGYLDNRVRRRGLIYVGVPELHKRGGIHFHFVMNSSALKLSDSGTVSVTGRKRPIKQATARRLGIPPTEWHTVYNVDDWKLGFSTAIMLYGDRGAAAHYMGKELFKVEQKGGCAGSLEKIGGRWYLSGGKLCKPVIQLDNVPFDGVSGETYSFGCVAGDFKVFQFRDDGSVLCGNSDGA